LQAKLSRNLRGFATTKSGNAAISYQLVLMEAKGPHRIALFPVGVRNHG
jgi:hypothetical protein